MAWAEPEDIATFLGRDLTTEEGAQAQFLIELATGTITAAVDKADEWAAGLDPVPAVLKGMAVSLATRAMRNPGGLRSQSESLGQYSVSESYTDSIATGVMMLKPHEELLVRRAVWGSTSGSAATESVVHDVHSCAEGS